MKHVIGMVALASSLFGLEAKACDFVTVVPTVQVQVQAVQFVPAVQFVQVNPFITTTFVPQVQFVRQAVRQVQVVNQVIVQRVVRQRRAFVNVNVRRGFFGRQNVNVRLGGRRIARVRG